MTDLEKWKEFLDSQQIPYVVRTLDNDSNDTAIDIGYDADGIPVEDYGDIFDQIPNASLGLIFDEDGDFTAFNPTGE